MHELRTALRRFARRPARGLATTLALAIGMGATTAAFAAVDAVLLRDLPVERQDELVVVWALNPERGQIQIPFRGAPFEAVSNRARTLEGVAAFSAWGPTATLVEDAVAPYVLDRVPVAGDFFGVLGARPAAGRLLAASDDAVGATPTAVLSHSTWQRRFEGDPAVVGTRLPMGDVTATVVGVAPEGFDFPKGTDVWTPYRRDYGVPPARAGEDIEVHLLARVADGVVASVVADEVRGILGSEDVFSGSGLLAGLQPVVVGLEEHVVGDVRSLLVAGWVAALLLLFVAGANATLFLLAGGQAAAHDVAVRRALGAERARVLARLGADAGLVGVLGVAAGVVFAWSALRVLLPMAPPELSRVVLAGVDLRAAAFAATVGALTTAVIGFTSGVVLSGVDLRDALAASGRGQVARGAGLRRGVAGLQVCLTVVSAIGAGLLIRTVAVIDRLDSGLAAGEITSVSLRVPYGWMDVPPSYLDALERVVSDLESRPGIVAARPTLGAPLQQRLEAVFVAEDQTEEERGENPHVAMDAVLPGHFEAMGIPLVAGRGITSLDDRSDADPVVVVDEVLARALWPGESALGKRMSGFGTPDTWFTVVGVAAATRYRAYLERHPRAYFPLNRLGNSPPAALLVRTDPDATPPVAELAREAFARADPSVDVMEVQGLSEALLVPTLGRRFAARILSGFAAATLLLAVLGVYGVFTVAVQERTREMGVRRALGARRIGLVGLVLGGILRVAGAGAVAGVLIAVWAGRWVEALLYGISPTDPATFAGVLLGSLVLAMAAGVVPAMRASTVDPAVSLRAE